MLQKIEALLKEISGLTATSAEEIEQLRLKYLSRKGEINALMADFRNVAAEEKKVVGVKINELKQLAFDHINALKEQLESGGDEADDVVDAWLKLVARAEALKAKMPKEYQDAYFQLVYHPLSRGFEVLIGYPDAYLASLARLLEVREQTLEALSPAPELSSLDDDLGTKISAVVEIVVLLHSGVT